MKRFLFLSLLLLSLCTMANKPNLPTYFIKEGKVYFGMDDLDFDKNIEMPMADVSTFVYGPKTSGYPYYARDYQYVYYNGKVVEGANSRYFMFLGGITDKDNSVSKDGYIKDSEHVFFKGEQLDDSVDIASFKIINPDHSEEPIAFRLNGFAHDRYRVYVHGKPQAGRDGASFKTLSCGYNTDSSGVYFQDKLLKNADPKSFKTFLVPYLTSNGAVYFNGRKRPYDMNTFEMVMIYPMGRPGEVPLGYDFVAKDKRGVYFNDEKLSLNPAQTEVIDGIIITDGKITYRYVYDDESDKNILQKQDKK